MRTAKPLRTVPAALLVIVTVLATVTGCSKARPVAQTYSRPANLNSHGLPKLTPEQVDKQIQSVQASRTIPDSAKPNIISSIRAQGEL